MKKNEDERRKGTIYKEEVSEKQDNYLEEYGAEFVPILSTGMITSITDSNLQSSWFDFSIAMIALFVSTISIFVLPIYLGILGTALGYFSYKKGERLVTPWAICLGIAGILIGIFII